MNNKEIRNKVSEILNKVMDSENYYTVTYFKHMNILTVYEVIPSKDPIELGEFNVFLPLDDTDETLRELDSIIERIV
jgi:hypothetical protein